MPVLGLSQTAFRPGHPFLLFLISPSYLFVGSLEQFREREFHMLGNAFDLRQTLQVIYMKIKAG